MFIYSVFNRPFTILFKILRSSLSEQETIVSQGTPSMFFDSFDKLNYTKEFIHIYNIRMYGDHYLFLLFFKLLNLNIVKLTYTYAIKNITSAIPDVIYIKLSCSKLCLLLELHNFVRN